MHYPPALATTSEIDPEKSIPSDHTTQKLDAEIRRNRSRGGHEIRSKLKQREQYLVEGRLQIRSELKIDRKRVGKATDPDAARIAATAPMERPQRPIRLG